MTADVLSDRALDRATLARQLLLERSTVAPATAVEHLVGLQAQNPLDPYLALWSRLESFDPVAVGAQVEGRELVRIVVMRGTIHLVTAADALGVRPIVQPVLDAELARHSQFAPHLEGVDLGPAMAFGREVLDEAPRTGTKLRAAMEERFPDLHAPALAYACRCLIACVQVPPRGVWGRTSAVALAPLETWVGRPLRADVTIDDVVLRYLAAFGPASVADVATWSGLTGMRAPVERLRPQLRTFRSESGRELFDLPDAPRPDPDTPAPVRFLPEYDNVLLSHADRSRFGSPSGSFPPQVAERAKGAVMVDGAVRGVWHVAADRAAQRSTVVVDHDPLPRGDRSAIEAEAHAVAAFWLPTDHTHDVRLVPIDR